MQLSHEITNFSRMAEWIMSNQLIFMSYRLIPIKKWKYSIWRIVLKFVNVKHSPVNTTGNSSELYWCSKEMANQEQCEKVRLVFLIAFIWFVVSKAPIQFYLCRWSVCVVVTILIHLLTLQSILFELNFDRYTVNLICFPKNGMN